MCLGLHDRDGLLALVTSIAQDVEAYRKVGVPVMRIFTVNSKGEIKSEIMETYRSSYVPREPWRQRNPGVN